MLSTLKDSIGGPLVCSGCVRLPPWGSPLSLETASEFRSAF